MNHETPAFIAISISIMTLINVALLLVSAYWKLPQAERCLINSRIVSSTRQLWKGNDPIAKLNRLCAVALVFTLGRLLERRGLIDRLEADRVPLSLRVWIVAPVAGSCVILMGAVGVWLTL